MAGIHSTRLLCGIIMFGGTLAVACGCQENPESSKEENQLRKPKAAFILPKRSNSAEDIDRVLKIDAELGKTRNHRSETASLSIAVQEYVKAVEAIDLDHCPNDFRKGMEDHLQAWKNSISFFETVPELRGEMHDLFDQLRSDEKTRQQILKVEKEVWGTWADVEKAKASAIEKARAAEEKRKTQKSKAKKGEPDKLTPNNK